MLSCFETWLLNEYKLKVVGKIEEEIFTEKLIDKKRRMVKCDVWDLSRERLDCMKRHVLGVLLRGVMGL